MHFEDPQLLLLLMVALPLVILLFRHKKQVQKVFAPDVLDHLTQRTRRLPAWMRSTLLILGFALMVVALARPVEDRGEISVSKSTIDLIAAFDISRSMYANDVYPHRLALAKRKFETFLGDVNETRVGVIGFSSRAFMVSPITEDFATLRYLLNNMNTESISLRGTSIMNALEQTETLLNDSEKKALLLFTDGGDQSDFSKEISYAKSHNIVPFVYNIGTEKGGVIETEAGALTDRGGNIVVVRRNDAIRSLALKSGGAYLPHPMKHDDIGALADAIKARFEAKDEKEETIKDVRQLFIYPLSAATVLLFLGLYGLPGRRMSHA